LCKRAKKLLKKNFSSRSGTCQKKYLKEEGRLGFEKRKEAGGRPTILAGRSWSNLISDIGKRRGRVTIIRSGRIVFARVGKTNHEQEGAYLGKGRCGTELVVRDGVSTCYPRKK